MASEKRMPELDGIRGVAILLVVIYHYVVCTFNQDLLNFWTSIFFGLLAFTWSGVDLFFVLSGFLLGGILLDHKNTSNYFQVFYVRRFCRILPLYFFWLFLWMALTYIIPSLTTDKQFAWLFNHRIGFGYYLTFTQNFVMARIANFGSNWLAVSWSLAIEEHFYLVLPLLIYLFSLRHLRYVFIIFIISAPILRTLMTFHLPHGPFQSQILMPCRADALFLGALCALAVREESTKRLIFKYLIVIKTLAILLLSILLMMVYREHALFPSGVTVYGYTLLAFFYACVLLIAVTEKQGIVSNIVRAPWLRELGIIAYGVYMFHEGIIALIHIAFRHTNPAINGWPDLVITIVSFIITIALARISWIAFEKPIVSFGHRWSYKF